MDNSLIPQMASVSELQKNYAALIGRAKRTGRPVLVLKKNKLEAVLLSSSLFTKLAEKARLYEEKQALETVASYEDEKKRGKLETMRRVDELII